MNLLNENCIAKKQHLDKQIPEPTSASRSLDAIASSNEIGLLRISKQTTWKDLNLNLKRLIVDYLNSVDPNQSLGVNSDSVYCYEIGDSKETFYLEQCLDELDYRIDTGKDQPFDYLTNDARLLIRLKCKSMLEQFVLETLIPKSVLLRLIGLFADSNKRLIISGQIGIGKTYLAHKLAEYLIQKLNTGDLSTSSSLLSSESSNSKLNEKSHRTDSTSKIAVGSIATYYVDAQNCHHLYHYLNSLVQQCEQLDNQIDYRNVPTILIIDNLQFVRNIDETFSPLSQLMNTSYMPYVIATYTQCSVNRATFNQHSSFGASLLNTNLQFGSSNFRWLTFSHLVEPASGLLPRFLRKKVITNLIEQKHNYLSEFNLMELDEKHLKKHLKDQSSQGLVRVLSDLESKKTLSFKIIDWLDQVLRHINHFIQTQSQSSTLGPRMFVDCPINDLDKTKDFFNACWNETIIPYLNEIIKSSRPKQADSPQIEDPSVWVIKSSFEINHDFNLKKLNLNQSKQSGEQPNKNIDPLVHALNNLNKLTNQ